MRTLVLFALLATACGKKAPPEAAAAPAPAEPEITAQMPDTPEARRFAAHLVETEVTGWPIAGGGDGRLVYESMTFAPDGTWTARATLEVGGESIGCQERGTWSIDQADSADNATMDWTISKTTCATRDAGTVTRVEMVNPKSGPMKIVFR